MEQWKKVLHSLRMSAEEKTVMKARLVRFVETHTTPETVPSPYVHHNFIFKPLQAVAFALVLVLGGGSGLAFASQNSLPGDALYNFKVNITEEIVALAKRGPEAKAQNAIERAARRLDETTELALAGKLTDTTKNSISRYIQEHTDDVRKYAKSVKEEQLQVELELVSGLVATLNPRTEILKEIKEEQHLNGELGGILAVTATNVEQIGADKKVVQEELERVETVTEKERVEAKATEVRAQLSELAKLIEKEEVAAILVEDDTSEDTTEIPLDEAETDEVATIVSLQEEPKIVTTQDKKDAIEELMRRAQEKIDGGYYGEALVLLQDAHSQAAETFTLIDLKETYAMPAKTEATTPAPVDEKPADEEGETEALEAVITPTITTLERAVTADSVESQQ